MFSRHYLLFFFINFCFLDILSSFKTTYRFGTKTSYRLNRFLNKKEEFKNFDNVDTCKHLHTFALFRHGSRGSSFKDLEEVINFVKSLGNISSVFRGAEILKDLEKFKQYGDKNLSKEGEEEHKKFGNEEANILKRYHSQLNSSNFIFESSSKWRAKKSGLFFKAEFDKVLGINSSDQIKDNDEMLRFFEKCLRYYKSIRKNKTMNIEADIFLNKNFENLKKEMLKKVGSLPQISKKILEMVYSVGGLLLGSLNSTGLADLWTEEAIQMLEYHADLNAFWIKGGGNPLNYIPSKIIMDRVLNSFQDAISKKSGKLIGSYLFGHLETVLPFVTLLGLYRDEGLDHKSINNKRLLKTSLMAPMGTNVILYLFNCNNNHVILTQVNGIKKKLPSCPDNFLCPYKKFKKFYSELNKINFYEICKADSNIKINPFPVSPSNFPHYNLFLLFIISILASLNYN